MSGMPVPSGGSVAPPYADTTDVEALWRPLSTDETARVSTLIGKAWAKLVQATPFNIPDRVDLHAVNPSAPTALDPSVVADVVASIVKRFLVNQEGAASKSEAAGPFSQSATFVSRFDKSGSDVRGEISVTPSDLEQLRPAIPTPVAGSIRVVVPDPRLLHPHGYGARNGFPGQAAITPDVWPGSGAE